MKSPICSQIPAERLLSVVPTRKRGHGLYYCVQINRATAKQLGVRKWIVATFEHPAIQHNPRLKGRLPFTAIHGRADIREEVPDGVAAVDQTIRNALGMPVPVFPDLRDVKIALFPARRALWHGIRTWCASLFGIRYMALRAKAADVADMEKSYVRIAGAALRSLGVLESDDIMVERPFAIFNGDAVESFQISYFRISAFLASDNQLEYRRSMENLFPRRYFNGALALYDYDTFIKAGMLDEGKKPRMPRGAAGIAEPDIPAIFMDFDSRVKFVDQYPGNIRIDGITPVLTRRSVSSAIARESLQTGSTFGIALLNMMLAVVTVGGGVSPNRIAIGIAGATVITIGLLVFRLRQEV